MTSSPDAYRTHAPTPGAPARVALAVTPDDEEDLTPYAKALYVGTAGDLNLIPAGGAVAGQAHAWGSLASVGDSAASYTAR